MDELCTFVARRPSRKNKRKGIPAQHHFLWLAIGRATSQVLAFHSGGRALSDAQRLIQALPATHSWLPMRTDEYSVYGELAGKGVVQATQLVLCPKGSGETSHIEGINTALRQRVSYLKRRTSAFARSSFWLEMRLRWFLHHWNLDAPKCLRRRQKRAASRL